MTAQNVDQTYCNFGVTLTTYRPLARIGRALCTRRNRGRKGRPARIRRGRIRSGIDFMPRMAYLASMFWRELTVTCARGQTILHAQSGPCVDPIAWRGIAACNVGVQCSAVQCRTVQYNVVQCRTVQSGADALQYSAVECSTVHYNAMM